MQLALRFSKAKTIIKSALLYKTADTFCDLSVTSNALARTILCNYNYRCIPI